MLKTESLLIDLGERPEEKLDIQPINGEKKSLPIVIGHLATRARTESTYTGLGGCACQQPVNTNAA